MIFGLSAIAVIGILINSFFIEKLGRDIKYLLSNRAVGFVSSIIINLVCFFYMFGEHSSDLLGLLVTVTWFNLVIWNRTIRYVPVFMLRFALIIIPFTAVLDLFLSEAIVGVAMDSMDFDVPDIQESEAVHFVDPHEVDGYYREDGTFIDRYYRDGDGDTTVNQSKADGGGYYQSNPDGDLTNNLKAHGGAT